MEGNIPETSEPIATAAIVRTSGIGSVTMPFRFGMRTAKYLNQSKYLTFLCDNETKNKQEQILTCDTE